MLRVSSGCVRLRADDIKYLFDNVPVGTRVQFVNQPVRGGAREPRPPPDLTRGLDGPIGTEGVEHAHDALDHRLPACRIRHAPSLPRKQAQPVRFR